MSRIVRSLCALPAFGALGTPTGFIGGSSGETDTTDTAVDVTTIGGRATTPSGTTIPAVGDPTRLNFMTLEATMFDGYSALYGLRRGSNSSNFSMSYWIQVTGGFPNGTIFGKNKTFLGPENNFFYMSYQGVTSPVGPFGEFCGGFASREAFNSGSGIKMDGISPPVMSNGWVNVLFSFKKVVNVYHFYCYVNDTPVNFSGTPIVDLPWGSGLANVLFSTADFKDANGIPCYWTIGGADSFASLVTTPHITEIPDPWAGAIPVNGDGLNACLSELWIGEGQFIDFSVAANRALFHNVDLAQLDWAPCSLGADGSTPTGTKPTIYCTGSPSLFPINRATGKKFRVFHDSLHAGGFENVLPACDGPGPQ